jgi:hypothetical protein
VTLTLVSTGIDLTASISALSITKLC